MKITKTNIYYFSGTGNSLKVARDLSAKLGDTEVISIPDIIHQDIVPSTACIGFVFPVYAYGLPLIVTRFIEKLTLIKNNSYIFAVATCKAEKGGVFYQVDNLLKNKGLKLSAGFSVKMPGNYIYSYDLEPYEVQEDKFKQWEDKLQKIVIDIKNKEFRIEQTSFLERAYQYKFIYGLASHLFSKWDKRFWSDDQCNGCGICQRVCPVMNITLKDKKPVWQNRCEQCFSCVNWCPKASIQSGKETLGRIRYHHPVITLKDVLHE